MRRALVALVALVVGLTVALQVLAGPASAAGPRALPPLPDQGAKGEWWFTSWRIPEVWQAGARGQGVTVAVVDSGVQASFPELAGAVLPGTDFAGGDGRVDAGPDEHERGHGTRMALFIAGQGGPLKLVGVAPEAKILPVSSDSGSTGQEIRWAVDHGAKVVNLSFSSIGQTTCPDETAQGVRYALDHGAVVVAGSGNDGVQSAGDPPADCPGVLAVGAVDLRARVWDKSNRGPYVSATAPGVDMRSPSVKREIGASSGTSDSCALTSAAVALVWSRYPKLTNRQVVARLLATVRDEGPPGRDDAFGYGVIRPYQAITTDVPADAPNPVFDAVLAAVPAATVPPAAPSARAGAVSTPDTRGAAAAAEEPKRLLLTAVVVAVVVVGVLVFVVVGITLAVRRSRRPPAPTQWRP